MEDFQHVGYSKEVIEFVAVAKEFCDFVETAPQFDIFLLPYRLLLLC